MKYFNDITTFDCNTTCEGCGVVTIFYRAKPLSAGRKNNNKV